MFEYEGSEYTLEEVTKAAEDKKLSVEDYVSKFNLKEIKTEQPVEKPNDVVVEDAAVTSEPEQASESMELESVDTSLVSQPKRRSVRGQQRAKELKDSKETNDFDTSIEAYKSAVSISEDEENIINKPIQDYSLYGNEMQQAKDYLIKNVTVNPGEDLIKKQADVFIKKNKRKKLKENKSRNFLDNLSTEQRKALIPYEVNEFIELDNEYKNKSNDYILKLEEYKSSPNFFNLQNISDKLENPDYKFDLEGLGDIDLVETLANRIKDLGDPENFVTQSTVDLYNSLVNKYKKASEENQTVKLENGKIIPKATYNLYKDLLKENIEVNEDLNSLAKDLEEAPTKLGDIESELEFLKKNYSGIKKRGQQLQTVLGNTGWNLLGGTARVITDITEMAGEAMGVDPEITKSVIKLNPIIPDLYNITDFAADLTEKAREKYQIENYKDVDFDNAFDSAENFGEFFAQELTGQAGTFAMLAQGRLPGAIGLGITSYEDQRRVLEEEQDLVDTKDSTLYKSAVSLGFAIPEVVLGFLPTFKIFNRGFKAADEQGIRKLVDLGTKKYVEKTLKRALVYDPAIEGGTEGLTQVVQNGVDILRGAKEFTAANVLENVDHATVSGIMLGPTFSSIPVVKGMVLNSLSDYNSYESYRKNLDEIIKLEDIYLSIPDKRTKAAKVIINQINSINKENNNIISEVEQKVNANLTKEGFDLFARATKEQESLRIEAAEIINDTSSRLSKAQKDAILKSLKQRFDSYQQARDNFRKDYKVNIDLLPNSERKKYIDTAKLELEQEGVETTDLNIKKRAEKLWQVETFDKNIQQDIKTNKTLIGSDVDQTYIVAETKEEAIEEFTNAVNNRLEAGNLTEQEAKKQIQDFSKGVKNGSVNAGNLITKNQETGKEGYDIVIVRPNAIANGKTSTGIHEIGHTLATEGLSSDPEAFRPMANSILEWLKKNNESAYNRISRRAAGKPIDEVITEFIEEVASKRLDLESNKNKGLAGVFSLGFTNAIKKATDGKNNFNLTNEADVVDFLTSLSKKLREGTLTIKEVQEIQKGKKESEVKTEKQFEAIVKESKIYQEVETFKDDLINKETKDATAFLIADKLENEVDRRLKINVDPETKEDIVRNFLFDDRRGLLGLLQKYDPARNESVMGYLNSNTPGGKLLDARLIEFYENDPRYNQIIQSTTDEAVQRRAEQVTAEEVVTEVTEERVTKKIKPTSLIPTESVTEIKKQVVAKVKDIPADKLSFKKLGDLAPDIIAEAIGIPVKKLVDPKANLSKGDANAIQRFVSKNADKLLKILPEGAVLEAATEKLIGTSTGVPKGLLNAFYTKQARVGKGAGLAPFKKNANITKADFLKAFGIVEGKKAEEFSARSPEAQALKGIANLYGRLVTNEVIRSETDLDLTKKQDVAAGKARLMFSKTDEAEINEFIEKQGFVKTQDELAAENKVWKFISKKLGIDFISSKNPEDVEAMKTWLTEKLAPKMPKSFMTQGTLANAGTSAAKRNFFLTSKQAIDDLFKGVEFAKEDADIAEAVIRKTYVTGGAEGKISTKFLKEFNSKEFKEAQVRKLKGLKKIFKTFETMIQEDPNNAKFIIALLSSTSQGMGHFIRTSAPIKFYSKNLEGGIVEEHTMPASLVAKYMFNSAVNGTVDADFKNIENNYFQGALGKNDDKKLKGKKPDGKPFNYTSMTPEGWKITDNIWARYFNLNVATNNFGIDPNNIVLSNGKTVFETFSVNSAGHKVSEQMNATEQKASESNNSKLPNNFKLKLSKSNPEVLNRMEELDSNAKQASKELYNSIDLDKDFNNILENKTGIASEKAYGKVKAEVAGASQGRFNFFIPPSAEDFVGLLYSTLGKGKLGDTQMAWYKKNLLNPYAKAMNELSSARIALMNDYKQLKKELKVVPKDLLKKVPGEPYTREQAVRVYIWNTQGMDVPGISKADLKDLTNYVSDNADLQVFADQLIAMQKGDQYAKPKEGWPAGTITTDLLEGLNTTKRTKYLEQWQSNVDVIFSEKNLNKLQAAYGKDYRKALENMLQRMKTGRNRNFSGDTLTGKFTDWITGSIGTIMFFNTRSAVLQTISAVNFVNFTDNNILAAGKAFGNQKQFWSDFLTLANSDFLKERRSGLRMNVNEADIAEMAKKGGVQGVINKLLEFGFTPTQLADSFAIASGGATFYRNRIKTYEKQGLDSKEAQEKAFTDFREIAEESQQSSRPDRISMQQAGSLGRLVLAFANTPAQYARLIKKAASDLKNGRGDAKTNISLIIYYGAVQNLIFNALQQALFAFAFGDTEPEDEEKEKKYVGIANGMMDSLLRGIGLGGAVVSVGKNALKRIYDEMQKKQPKLEKVGYELTKLSPPISAKLSRINQAARSYQWDKKEMAEKGWSLDNPAYLAGANVVSALTNIPLDRAVKKTNNVIQATSQDLETWERMALLGGWSDWEIGIKEENETTKPQPRKIKKRKIKKKIIK